MKYAIVSDHNGIIGGVFDTEQIPANDDRGILAQDRDVPPRHTLIAITNAEAEDVEDARPARLHLVDGDLYTKAEYRAYLKSSDVPVQITRYQFFTQLAKQGDLVSIKAFVSALDEESQTRFDTASVFKRAHVLFNAALPALEALDSKWTAEYVDTLFKNAAKITD